MHKSDTATGLYYLKTRYYDPEVGRFITIDDVSYLAPDTINGLNLYAYCGNNPVMRVDHEGTSWWSDFWNSTAGKVVGTIFVIAAIVTVSILTAGLGTAITGALGGGLIASMVGGAIGGAFSGLIWGAGLNIATQGFANGYGNINWNQVTESAFIGMASGAISGGVLGGLKYLVSASKLADKISGLSVAKERMQKAKEALKMPRVFTDGGSMNIIRDMDYVMAGRTLGLAQSINSLTSVIIAGIYKALEVGLKQFVGAIIRRRI